MGYNDENVRRIVIDIETVAAPGCADLLDPVKAPAHYKDPAKIAVYCDEKQHERIASAGLEADLCEVVAVGWRLDDGPTAVLTRADGAEETLLGTLWSQIDVRAVVGFNVLGFDLPVLIRRSQLLGVAYPSLNLDRYRTPHIDLIERLTFNGKLTYRSLAFYCRLFGIPCADLTKGADIALLVADGKWADVAAHCRADVEKTATLAQRLGWLALAETVVV